MKRITYTDMIRIGELLESAKVKFFRGDWEDYTDLEVENEFNEEGALGDFLSNDEEILLKVLWSKMVESIKNPV